MITSMHWAGTMVLVFLILSKSMIHKQAYGHLVSPCFQNAAGSHPITTQTEVEFFPPGIQFSFLNIVLYICFKWQAWGCCA